MEVVRTVSEFRALELQSLMKAARLGGAPLAPGIEKILVCDRAMMVDLLNDDPYVFVMPDTMHVFKSTPGSGTDRLRQRIKAEIFFQEISQNPNEDQKKSRPGASRQV